MVSFSAKVTGVGPVRRPDGSVGVGVSFGVPLIAPQPRRAEEKNTHTLHIEMPGQQLNVPVTENRLILFLSEEEWSGLEHKPVYGETYSFVTTKDGFKMVKEETG